MPLQQALKLAKQFNRNESGNVFIIAALMIFVLMSVAGAAIDYSRITSTKSKMANAMDAAVLAAGYDLSKGVTDKTALREKFENFFFANITGTGGDPSLYRIASFEADPNTGKVSAVVKSTVQATLTAAIGMDALDVKAETEGVFDQTDVEVAMMLDVTGSMRGQKIADLKLAARDAVDILLPDNGTQGMRIGLVPYASSINAGRYAKDVTRGNRRFANADGFTDYTRNVRTRDCVTGRAGRDATTDASYRQSPLGSHEATVNAGNAFFRCPDAEIIPLTNNRTLLKREISQFVADGYTGGHLGIAWSYYMLSENWRDLWSTPNDPAAYSADVKKIAILMTDGEFNTAFEGIGNNNPFGANVARSNNTAKDLCEDMKATKNGNPGITIYAIAFQAPSSAEATLRACANDDTAATTYYYSADNGTELREAFREIAASITNLRISR